MNPAWKSQKTRQGPRDITQTLTWARTLADVEGEEVKGTHRWVHLVLAKHL